MGQNRTAVILFSISLIVVLALITILSFGVLRTSWSYSFIVEPIDVINLLVTVLVTIFVAWYVTKKLSEERFDKELIISDLKSIEACIEKILEAYEPRNANGEILNSINELHILINRFERTIETRKISTHALRNSFWSFFAVATDYDSGNDTDNIDLPMVQRLGDDLIIEIRRIIGVVNTK